MNFSWGSNINNPNKTIKINKTELMPENKWTQECLLNKDKRQIPDITIGSFFNIKRGIATGDNSFFIINDEIRETYNIPLEVLTPLMPPPRKLKSQIYKG